MLAQEHSDRGGRDLDPELEQFALDATISPAWVLSCHLEDQGFGLLGETRSATTGAALKGCPLAPDQLVMPAQQRGRREHQLARLKVATEGDQDQPVGWQESGPLDLAAQDGDLVPKRQNLNLQFFGRATVEFDGAHDQLNDRIDGCEEHERGPSSSARPVVVAKQPEVPPSQADMLRAAGREWNHNGLCAHHRISTPLA